MSNSEYGKRTSSDSRISQLTSDEQTFNDRLSLIVRQLNNPHEYTYHTFKIGKASYSTPRIISEIGLLKSDIELIQSEFTIQSIFSVSDGMMETRIE